MATNRSKYSLWGRFNFEDLYNAFLGLEQRQQVLLIIGSIFLVILLLVLPVSCASSKLSKLEKDYSKEKKGREQIMEKINKYQSAKSQLVATQKKLASGKQESLTTLIESIANEVGIGSNINRLKPMSFGGTDYFDEEGVDAVLEKVTLDQVTDFLFRLEQHKGAPLKFKKITIKPRYGRRGDLSVNFQLATLKLKGEEIASE